MFTLSFKKISFFLAISSFLLMTASYVHAADPQSFKDGLKNVSTLAGDNGLAKAQSTKQILQTIVAWLTSLLATVAMMSLLYGGYLYISSQGDESSVTKAKSILLYSIIGIILIGLSAVIVNTVISVATQ
jgi:voltage-gated potassium channel Kch